MVPDADSCCLPERGAVNKERRARKTRKHRHKGTYNLAHVDSWRSFELIEHVKKKPVGVSGRSRKVVDREFVGAAKSRCAGLVFGVGRWSKLQGTALGSKRVGHLIQRQQHEPTLNPLVKMSIILPVSFSRFLRAPFLIYRFSLFRICSEDACSIPPAL